MKEIQLKIDGIVDDKWRKREEVETGYIGSHIPYPPLSSLSFPVSRSFRSWFVKRFRIENLKKGSEDLKLFRLASFLLPGSYVNYSENGRVSTEILMSADFASKIMRPGGTGHDLNIGDLLKLFERRFWKLNVRAADRLEGTARVIVGQVLPLELRVELDKEVGHIGSKDLVDLVSGMPWPNEMDSCNLPGSPIEEVERIRKELNSLPVQLFDCIVERVPAAIERANGFKTWSVESQRHQIGILRKVAATPKPVYKAVEKTSRLYAHGASWLGLHRNIRETLTGELWKFDLSSAQLRIASALWGFALKTDPKDGSVWSYLLRACGSRPNNLALKHGLKGFVYPALFGESRANLKKRATDLGNPKLLYDPLINSLLDARSEVLNKLSNGQELDDAWGRSFKVTSTTRIGRATQGRSYMASICQSWELRLLLPVFDYAKQNGLTIVALLHDGIYAAGDWMPHVDQVKKLVNDEARNLLKIDMPLDACAPRVTKVKDMVAA